MVAVSADRRNQEMLEPALSLETPSTTHTHTHACENEQRETNLARSATNDMHIPTSVSKKKPSTTILTDKNQMLTRCPTRELHGRPHIIATPWPSRQPGFQKAKVTARERPGHQIKTRARRRTQRAEQSKRGTCQQNLNLKKTIGHS